MTQKKNRFWTFLFSFMPGAGEMYMGFMKMGVSLMGMFFLIITIATILEIGPIIFLAVIAWFYSFFHVHNLAGMPDEEFYSLEDEYLFNLSAIKMPGADMAEGYRRSVYDSEGAFPRPGSLSAGLFLLACAGRRLSSAADRRGNRNNFARRLHDTRKETPVIQRAGRGEAGGF